MSLWVCHCPCVMPEQRGARWRNEAVCGTTEAFLGSPFTKAVDPLFSGGLGCFRRLLYFSDNRQSVGSAAKHPPAVTSPCRWWPCFLFPCGSQKADTCSSLFFFLFLSSSCSSCPRLLSSRCPFMSTSLLLAFHPLLTWCLKVLFKDMRYPVWRDFVILLNFCFAFLVIPFFIGRWQCCFVLSLGSWRSVCGVLIRNPSHHHSALSQLSFKPCCRFVLTQPF